MTFTRPLRRRRTAALGAAACMAVGSLTLALSVAPAGAGTQGRCAGDHVLEWQHNEDRLELVRVGDVVGLRDVELTTPLEAGTYDVETIAYDGFIGRADEPEPVENSERYMIQFVDVEGNVVGETGTTDDLTDGVEEIEQRFSWQVDLSGTATGVRFVQVADFEGPEDLVGVGCIGVSAVLPPATTPTTETPTTQTPTTEPPVTPVTETPTTAPPATAAPTTAAPVEVSTAAVTAPARTLPLTGPHTGQLVTLGALLLGAGGALVVRARRLA
ncbi:MAG: hypothetical protein GEV08_00615 [Acidimicrobiia bacterium]|nr:hypothetical protein [Acidimicrobiia bacterium]